MFCAEFPHGEAKADFKELQHFSNADVPAGTFGMNPKMPVHVAKLL